MTTPNTLETLIYDKKARKEFFDNLDRLIKLTKDCGFYKAAMDHTESRKRLWDHVTMLD